MSDSVQDRMHKFGVAGRFKYRQLVLTTKDNGDRGWVNTTDAARRPWNRIGTVEDIGTGHGTCYLVSFSDGMEYWYNQEELEAM